MLPNFLIIGAAKAGTSSLYYYINQHPDIYTSPIKGPAYFAYPDGVTVQVNGPGDQAKFDQSLVTDFTRYCELFAGVQGERAVGEASVLYLYQPLASRRIHCCLPDVRLVVCLRNPADRAFSSYMHLRRDGRETFARFEDALSAENERVANGWQHLWHYTRMGFYHEQLQRYYDRFPHAQIGVFLYDDFVRDPITYMQSIFRFLDVDPSFVPDMSIRRNISGMPKSRRLHNLLNKPNALMTTARHLLPPRTRQRLGAWVQRRNLDKHRQTLSPATRRNLIDLYTPDLLQLEGLIQRDLSAWHQKY